MGVNFRSGCNLLFCVSRSYNGKFAKTVIISLAYYRGGRLSNEILAFVVFALLALIIFLLLWSRDPSIAKDSAQSGLLLFLRYSFLIIFSMLIAAMLPTLISREIIVQYLGGASGWRGILMATLRGGLTPGAPYAVVPLIAGLMKQGMSFAPAMSKVCAWGLWSLGRVPFQAAVLGGRFTLIQVLVSLPLPLIAGFFTELLLKFI